MLLDMTNTLPRPIAAHVASYNDHNPDALMATFAPDALVNDAKREFFGRDAISFVVVLPIALPGIITGMALNSFAVFWGFGLSFWTIVVGHATFCIVIVYNNVLARLRRVPRSLEVGSTSTSSVASSPGTSGPHSGVGLPVRLCSPGPTNGSPAAISSRTVL